MINSLITTGREALLSRMRKVPSKATQPSQPQPVFHVVYTLCLQQMQDFFYYASCLGKGNDNYEEIRNLLKEKVGEKYLLKNHFGRQELYEMRNGFKQYTYLAALEALHAKMFSSYKDNFTGETLPEGEYTFFHENGYVVKYRKGTSKLAKQAYRSARINLNKIEITYCSPEGSFMIEQDSINDHLYRLYYSEDISEDLKKLLNQALEKTFCLESGEIEKNLSSSPGLAGSIEYQDL